MLTHAEGCGRIEMFIDKIRRLLDAQHASLTGRVSKLWGSVGTRHKPLKL
jgi:hypothetical protein